MFEYSGRIDVMKTISFISQKGGSGKTTLSTSIACEAEQQGIATVLIDVDPQGSAYKWSKRREADFPEVLSSQTLALPDILNQLKENGAELVVIDTRGASSADIVSVAKLSDLVLIPSRTSQLDIDAIEDTINACKVSEKEAFVLFNAVYHSSVSVFEEARMVVKQSFGVDSLPMKVSNRNDFLYCMTEGKTPAEYEPNGKADLEVKAVFDWIKKKTL